ncbi:hypothetical protein ACFL2T_05145 [Elusimicrobiota bacterium]
MVNPSVVEYIKKYRAAGYTDPQIWAEISKTGEPPAAIDAAFAAANDPVASPAVSAPPSPAPAIAASAKPARKKSLWLLGIVGLVVVAVVAVGALWLLKPSNKSIRAPAVQARIDAYTPDQWNGHPFLSEFLPSKGPGDAAKDYARATGALMRADFKCGSTIDESGHVEAIGHLENAVGRNGGLILGGALPFSTEWQGYIGDAVSLTTLGCFAHVFGLRADRLMQDSDTEGAIREAKKQVAMGAQLMGEWNPRVHLFGVSLVAEGLLRLGKILGKGGRQQAMEVRIGYALADLLVNSLTPKEIAAIRSIAQDPGRLNELSKYLSGPGMRVHAPIVLAESALRWSAGETSTATADPARRQFLMAATGHPDPTLATLATCFVAVLENREAELRAVGADGRTEKARIMDKMLRY